MGFLSGLTKGFSNIAQGISNLGMNLPGIALNQFLGKKMMQEQHKLDMDAYGKRYQMQVADMKAAGINPLLSAGLSAPNVQGADYGMPGYGISTPADAMRAEGEQRNVDSMIKDRINQAAKRNEEIKLAQANTKMNELLGKKYESDTVLNEVEKGLKAAQTRIQEITEQVLDRTIRIDDQKIFFNGLRNELAQTVKNCSTEIMKGMHGKENKFSDYFNWLTDNLIKEFKDIVKEMFSFNFTFDGLPENLNLRNLEWEGSSGNARQWSR